MAQFLRDKVNELSTKNSWRRKWQPSPVFLPGKSYGQRSLVGYRPQGHKEMLSLFPHVKHPSFPFLKAATIVLASICIF